MVIPTLPRPERPGSFPLAGPVHCKIVHDKAQLGIAAVLGDPNSMAAAMPAHHLRDCRGPAHLLLQPARVSNQRPPALWPQLGRASLVYRLPRCTAQPGRHRHRLRRRRAPGHRHEMEATRRAAPLSKVQSVDQRMRPGGFRQLRTCRRTRPGQLCAKFRRQR